MMRPSSRRDGFTLAEVLISMLLFGVLVTLTLGVIDQQIRAFYSGSAQVDATQSLRFSMGILEKDLVTVGSGVPPEQPHLIYADTHVVAFNADFASNIIGDPSAVYVDSTLPNALVSAVGVGRQFTIPGTTTAYPTTNYTVAGVNSPAETITFYFVVDSATSRTDDYLLWRKVNDQPAELVARNILKPAAGPFIRYHRRVTPVAGAAYTDSVAASQLPLFHAASVHGSTADTGTVAVIDSVRAVEVRFRTMDARPNASNRTFDVRRVISLPNAGKVMKKTCGDEPIFGNSSFTATPAMVSGQRVVQLHWVRATDEAAGEQDVMRYVIWKSTSLPVGTGDPYLSIPAGNTVYFYDDSDVLPGVTYYYAIAAQDCTPSLSSLLTHTVTVP